MILIAISGRRRLTAVGVGLGLLTILSLRAGCRAAPVESTVGVVFRSDWSAGADSSKTAVNDGGRWDHYWEFNRGTGVQLLSVVPGGPGGRNALRVLQRGETFAANLQQENVVPPSTDFYVRFYMRNDDTSRAADHVVTAHTWKYGNLTYMRKWGEGGGWRFEISLYGCGFTYPIGHWSAPDTLDLGVWYRFEYQVAFVDDRHVQVHPRVFNANDSLILSDADIQQQNWGGASWNGRDDWTLSSYYAAGYSFCVEPAALTSFGLGNNGQRGAADTGLSWYFAGVEIRTDYWPGP